METRPRRRKFRAPAQPAFSFNPWGAISLFTPLLAGASAVIFARVSRIDIFSAAPLILFLGTLGGCNGYVLATAIRDNDRRWQACVLGAVSAAVSYPLFQSTSASAIFFALCIGFIIARSVLRFGPMLLFMLTIIGVVSVIFLAALKALIFSASEHALSGEHRAPGLTLVAGFIFVHAWITGGMSAEDTFASVGDALFTGLRGALYGVVVGDIVMLVVELCLWTFFSRENWRIASAVGTCAANYVCIYLLFNTAATMRELPTAEPDPPTQLRENE